MDGNLELNNLIGDVSLEFDLIDDELNIQTEKLKGVQQKLGINKECLNKNLYVLNKLKESTRMDKIIKAVLSIFILFSLLFSIAKYFTFEDLIIDLKKIKNHFY